MREGVEEGAEDESAEDERLWHSGGVEVGVSVESDEDMIRCGID